MSNNKIDMLARLYDLPCKRKLIEELLFEKIVIRRARSYEKSIILKWIESEFSKGWASECDACFSHLPITVHIATKNGDVIGFSCHEATHKNYFGPIGVLEKYKNNNLGTALLLTSMHAMYEMGYAYAIIGGPTNAVEFYKKAVGAIPIPGSTPGIYTDRLNGSDS